MNERFDAQLRRHLAETADPYPGEGQLASVIDGVAATTQRHPRSAWLLWDTGRIRPIASAAIRYGLIAVALLLALVAGALLASGAKQPSSVFEGTRITMDRGDGSGMTLVVGPGPAPALYFEDGYASGIACVNDLVKRFTARGNGAITEEGLVATFPDGGGCGLRTVDVFEVFVHDQGDDTLIDQAGVVWVRALEP